MSTLRAIAPWIVGLAILAGLAVRIDIAQTGAALAACDLAAYLGFSLLFIGAWLAIDTLALAALLPDTGRQVSFLALARVRAATYPVMAINFHLASVALLAGLASQLGTSTRRVAGTVLVYYVVDLVALCALALAGSAVLNFDAPAFRIVAVGLAATSIVALIALRRSGRRFEIFRAASEIPARRLLSGLLLRALLHASFAVFVVLGAGTFGIEIPLAEAAARTPIVLAVGALPIAAGGIGTSQAALVFFFAPYAPEAKLLAFGLAYTFTLLVLRVPIGGIALGLEHFSTRRLEENRV